MTMALSFWEFAMGMPLRSGRGDSFSTVYYKGSRCAQVCRQQLRCQDFVTVPSGCFSSFPSCLVASPNYAPRSMGFVILGLPVDALLTFYMHAHCLVQASTLSRVGFPEGCSFTLRFGSSEYTDRELKHGETFFGYSIRGFRKTFLDHSVVTARHRVWAAVGRPNPRSRI